MAYNNRGTEISTYDSLEEHILFEKMTKRQLFLIVKKLTQEASGVIDAQDWVKRTHAEAASLKAKGIK